MSNYCCDIIISPEWENYRKVMEKEVRIKLRILILIAFSENQIKNHTTYP